MRKYCLTNDVDCAARIAGIGRSCATELAETGAVSVVFTKGGFIIGVGGGQCSPRADLSSASSRRRSGRALTFRGKHYVHRVGAWSVGFTVGASTTKFVGRALNLRSPGDLAGSYATAGAGGAVAAGAGGVQLQNANGVILQLSGPRVGAEVSAAVGGVTIAMQ